MAYTFQWKLCDSAGQNCAAVPGETAQTFGIPNDGSDDGKTARCTVTRVADGLQVTSPPTVPITPPGGPFSPINSRGIYLISFGSTGAIAGFANLPQYDFLMSQAPLLTSGDADIGAIAAQPGISMCYVDSWTALSAYNQSVDYAQAASNGWFALTSGSARIGTYGNPSSAEALLLVDHPGYQAQVIANAKATAANYPGLKGFIIDNILPDYTANLTGVGFGNYVATAYPSASAWRTAILNWVKNVGGALRAAGFFVVVNMTGFTTDAGFNEGTFQQSWLTQIAATGGVDGVNQENFMQSPNSLGTMRRAGPIGFPCFFEGWVGIVSAANAAKVHFFANQDGIGGNVVSMRYNKAAFMLAWDGIHGAANYFIADGVDPWNAAWTATIGAPTGAYTQIATNVFFRQFTNGFVVVNANVSGGPSWTGTVGGNSYTVAAADALIHAGP